MCQVRIGSAVEEERVVERDRVREREKKREG
jgi:hypothetical protein